MEKKSVRQLSLLGLVLMGASALTAAIVPSKPAPEQGNSLNNGTLRQFSGGNDVVQNIVSCVVIAGAPLKCHVTAGTGTSVGAATSVVRTAGGGTYTTRGNTSQSISGDGNDTTSILTLV